MDVTKKKGKEKKRKKKEKEKNIGKVYVCVGICFINIFYYYYL